MTFDTFRITVSVAVILFGIFALHYAAHAREKVEKTYASTLEVLERIHEVMYPTVALALLDGNWEGKAADAIPQDVWDKLYEQELIRSGGDDSGESWPLLTDKGAAVLLSSLQVRPVSVEALL